MTISSPVERLWMVPQGVPLDSLVLPVLCCLLPSLRTARPRRHRAHRPGRIHRCRRTSRPARAATSPRPTCLPQRPISRSTTAPAWFRGRPMRGPSRPRASRWICTPPASTIPALMRDGAQRRHLSGREPGRQDQGLSRRRRRRQATTDVRLRQGLHQPFGIAFYPPGPDPKYVYIGDTDDIVRFPYKNGDLKASGPMENLSNCPAADGCAAAATGPATWSSPRTARKLFASVGSHSNVDDSDTHPEEFHRADVLEFTPEGKFVKVYASGLRNCVGEAINPITGELWCSTNERDAPGQQPRSRLRDPRAGGRLLRLAVVLHGPARRRQDPRHQGKHPELQSKVITPDILVNPHFASLEMLFYEGSQFPAEFKGDGFAAEHGSWNRAQRVRLRSDPPAHEERPRHRRVRGLPDRLHRRRRPGLGPARGRHRGQRRFALRLRRRLEFDLARDLRRASRFLTAGTRIISGAPSFRLFPAKGWESMNLIVRIHTVRN